MPKFFFDCIHSGMFVPYKSLPTAYQFVVLPKVQITGLLSPLHLSAKSIY